MEGGLFHLRNLAWLITNMGEKRHIFLSSVETDVTQDCRHQTASVCTHIFKNSNYIHVSVYIIRIKIYKSL